MKPFYIYEMKNTNVFSAYSGQPLAISNNQKLLYQAELTTGCQTRQLQQRPFNVLRSMFKVRTGETKETRGEGKRGWGDGKMRKWEDARMLDTRCWIPERTAFTFHRINMSLARFA